jgi:outer membrane protein assembly factor BamB
VRVDSTDVCETDIAPPQAPVVVGSKVYATEVFGKIVTEAATGTVDLRFDSYGYNGGNSVVVGGLWIFLVDDKIDAMDPVTGDLVWQSAAFIGPAPRLSSTGDLILVAQQSGVTGLSRLTGETVWDGGELQGVGGSPVIGSNRIFVATLDGVHAFGPL